MTRLGVIFWSGLVLASGFATFNVKYAVQRIDEEVDRVRRQTIAQQQEIRVLTAEWAYLNQPERLAELNRTFLQLVPITARQMQGRIEEIALRAPPVGTVDAIPNTAAAATPSAVMPASPARAERAEKLLVAEVEKVFSPDSGTNVPKPQATETSGSEALRAEAGGGGTTVGASAAGPGVLAEALRLLGIDGGGRMPPVRQSMAAPVAEAQIPAARSTNTGVGDTPIAVPAPAGVRAIDASVEGEGALAEALHLLGIDGGGKTSQVHLVKATPASLDALIQKIADTR